MTKAEAIQWTRGGGDKRPVKYRQMESEDGQHLERETDYNYWQVSVIKQNTWTQGLTEGRLKIGTWNLEHIQINKPTHRPHHPANLDEMIKPDRRGNGYLGGHHFVSGHIIQIIVQLGFGSTVLKVADTNCCRVSAHRWHLIAPEAAEAQNKTEQQMKLIGIGRDLLFLRVQHLN